MCGRRVTDTRGQPPERVLKEAGYELFPEDNTHIRAGAVVCYLGYTHRKIAVERYLLKANVSYEARESAKKAGFNRNPAEGRWEKHIDTDELKTLTDTSFFQFEILKKFSVTEDMAVMEEMEEAFERHISRPPQKVGCGSGTSCEEEDVWRTSEGDAQMQVLQGGLQRPSPPKLSKGVWPEFFHR